MAKTRPTAKRTSAWLTLTKTARSARMLECLAALDRIANRDRDVLIQSPTGCGKDLVCEAIHERSRRAGERFVVVDCGTLVGQLGEGRLRGHAHGAFTGTVGALESIFEQADGGTLVLDEIGDIDELNQKQLLRALQKREIMRLGEATARPFDVRVIAATNKVLRRLVKAGLFREDLYYRLAVTELSIPRIAERAEDVPGLIRVFAEEIGLAVTPDALEVLASLAWPGNVRQIENRVRGIEAWVDGVIDFAAARRIRDAVEADAADAADYAYTSRPSELSEEQIVAALRRSVRELIALCGGWPVDLVERLSVEELLKASSGCETGAAVLAGIKRGKFRSAKRRWENKAPPEQTDTISAEPPESQTRARSIPSSSSPAASNPPAPAPPDSAARSVAQASLFRALDEDLVAAAPASPGWPVDGGDRESA